MLPFFVEIFPKKKYPTSRFYKELLIFATQNSSLNIKQ